jgi:5-methylcytosine-specific restriction endonuclease McrA
MEVGMEISKKWHEGSIRRTIFKRQKGKCCYCKRELNLPVKNSEVNNGNPRTASLEHLIPKCDGGTNDPDNLAVACISCNSIRGTGNISWLEFATIMEEIMIIQKETE